MLHHYAPERVHKDEISDAVRREYPNAGRDQQVRHLKRDGWNIAGSGGFHQLADPYRPDQGFVNERNRRQGEPDNIILQCQFCNRAYRRDFVFDSRGRARAVADVGPVRRANRAVQRKIWELLRQRFGGAS